MKAKTALIISLIGAAIIPFGLFAADKLTEKTRYAKTSECLVDLYLSEMKLYLNRTRNLKYPPLSPIEIDKTYKSPTLPGTKVIIF